MSDEKKPRLYRVSLSCKTAKNGTYRQSLSFNIAAASLQESIDKLKKYAEDHQWTEMEVHAASFVGDLIL